VKKVEECCRALSAGVDIVAPSVSVEEVIQRVTEAPSSRSVFVVDEEKGLVGIIHARELMRLLGAKYVEDAGLGSAREFMARSAADLMRAPHSLSPEDTLETALRMAVQNELYDIPVVRDGKVIGNLDCLEIIVNYRSES